MVASEGHHGACTIRVSATCLGRSPGDEAYDRRFNFKCGVQPHRIPTLTKATFSGRRLAICLQSSGTTSLLWVGGGLQSET